MPRDHRARRAARNRDSASPIGRSTPLPCPRPRAVPPDVGLGTSLRPWKTRRIEPVPSASVHSRLALAVRVGTLTEWTLPAIRTRRRHWTCRSAWSLHFGDGPTG